MSPVTGHDHLIDIKRDAIALWLAVASSDLVAQQNLVANTQCPACLAIQVAVLGITLTADEPFLNHAGFIEMPQAELEDLENTLAIMREGLESMP